MKKRSLKAISILLVLTLVLGFIPLFPVTVKAVTINQQNIADRADFFFNTTWVCQKDVNAWRDEFIFQKGETYHLPYGQPVNSGKFIGYGVELEDFLMAAADADSVFYSTQSEFNGWTSVYYATDCAAFVAMCWGTVRQDCSTLPYYSTYKGKPTKENVYSILQLGDALDSTTVGHVVLVSDLIYDTNGQLIQIEITEQTPPQLKRTYFTPAELAAKYGEEFGIYRYEGSVPAVPEWGYTTECTNYAAYCTLEITEDTSVMSLPCTAAVEGESVFVANALNGQTYTATRLYQNTASELWYRISLDGDQVGYIPASATVYRNMLLDDITLSDATYPNAHVKGKTFSLVGNIYSKYNQLVTVSGYIYQGFGINDSPTTGGTDYVTGNAYTLKSSKIDYATSFGDLVVGNHTMAFSATYRNYHVENGSVIEHSGTMELGQDYFMVVSSTTNQSSCNHRYAQTVITVGSCTQPALSVFACATCGHVYQQRDDAIGHNFGDWNVSAATCTEEGSETRTCTTCGTVETNVLPASGHKYTETFIEGSCQECPHSLFTCVTCGEQYRIYPEEVLTPWQDTYPEEMDADLIEIKTQYRGSQLEITLSAEPELDGYTYMGESWETVQCETLDYVKQFPSGFDTENPLYRQYDIAPYSSIESETEKVTIDSDSVSGYLYYHWCYDNSYYSQAIQTGQYTTFHAYYSTIAPENYRVDTSDWSYCTAHETCSNTGWYFVAKVNTQVITRQQKMYRQGRWQEYGEWMDIPIEASDVVRVETRVLYRYPDQKVAGHQYVISTTPPTCTEAGTTNYACSVCGEHYQEELPPLGHDFVTVTVEATCTTDGSITHTCNVCGETQTQTILATGHSHEAIVTAPGCVDAGYTTYTCHCGDSYIADSVAALGHNYESITIDPTCVEDGSCTAICVNCGDTQANIIPATGHNFQITTFAPTCTQAGYTTYTCVCGFRETTDEIKAFGHSYVRIIQEATCVDDGSITEICEICEDTQIKTIPALGHQYQAVVTPPTCTAGGYSVYTCNCGDSFVTEETEATGHRYQTAIVDATCTADGSICATCSECGDTKVGIVPATGHQYENGNCLACGEPEPEQIIKPTLTLKSPTLEFRDMICIVAFYTAENIDNVAEMGMITYREKVDEWGVETADYIIPGSTYDTSSGRYYSRSQGIHAKYLGDTIYLACYAKLTDGSYVYTKLAPYSPITYAKSQLNNSTNIALKQLVVAMLNYGTEAQVYFGHNIESLANAGLTSEQAALPEIYREDMTGTVPATSVTKQGDFINNAGFSSRKPAISFEGAFCINYFFTPQYAPTNGITLYYWYENDYNNVSILTAENASGSIKMQGTGINQYRGDLNGISAKNLSQAIYVAAVYTDGTNTWTSGVLGYSIGAYCSSQVSKGSDIADLAMATSIYGYHAKQYFG